MKRRNGSENPFGGVNPGRYGSGWGRLGTEGESCLYVLRRLDPEKKRVVKKAYFDKYIGLTFVFRGRPELG